MSDNYKELRAVVKMARELGVNRVSVLRLVPQGRAANYENIMLTDDEHLDLRKSMLMIS
jgi:MoaA/NifB/PqqE/SkfB family radical SAM enzyme